jgi:sister chromatid cohesion protein DCC1
MDTKQKIGTKRTVSDVDNVIQLAKLETSELMPTTQVVEFSNQLIDQAAIKILEVPNTLVEGLMNGSSLVIRGDQNNSAVLCCDQKTFDLKEAETSNSLLFLDNLKFPEECENPKEAKLDASHNINGTTIANSRVLHSTNITGIFYRYLELKECRPRLGKLRKVLSGEIEVAERKLRLYSGPQSAEEGTAGASLNDLLDTIQCSEVELIEGLKTLRAIAIPSSNKTDHLSDSVECTSRWFMIDVEYHMRVLSLICNYIEESGWAWDCYEIERCKIIVTISEVEPNYVVAQVFDFYFHCLSNDGTVITSEKNEFDVKEPLKYAANKDSICKFYGEFLLATSPKYQLSEFISMWQKAVPGGEDPDLTSNIQSGPAFQVKISQLKGSALVDLDNNEIKTFPEWKLPVEIQERLQVLFSEREKWTLEDIYLYVENLTTPKLNANALLTKYSKVTTGQDGKKMFCAKHGK